jgi:uncharacterized delta-60 repeat protein
LPGWDRAADLEIQPDCKIVTVGHVGTFFSGTCVVSRFLPDGSPDSSFGINGISTFSLSGNDELNVVALQPDGKIVVAGGQLNGALGVARLLPNGTLDPSFGDGGKVVFMTSSPKLDAPAKGLAIQPDGKILVATKSDASNGQSDNMSIVLRLSANGDLDQSFGTGGMVTLNAFLGLHELISSFALQTDGKILVASQHFGTGSVSTPVLVRLSDNGAIDSSFGNNGYVSLLIGESVRDLNILPDGRIIGIIQSVPYQLFRLLPNGNFDLAFGTNGIANINPSPPVFVYVYAYSLTLQDDGKIVLGGFADTPTHNFFTARYDTSGNFDSTFASYGHIILPDLPSVGEIVNAIDSHGTGFIGAGAHYNALNQNDLVIFRLTNGTSPTAPTAGFNADQNGFTVSFTNTSAGATDYLWDFGDGQISSLAEPEHTYANNGTYEVKLTAYNKCVADESVQTISINISGTNEKPEKNELAVFPNPNNGSFTIGVNSDIQGELNCSLVNSSGQIVGYRFPVLHHGTNQLRLDFGFVPQGIYTLKINTREKASSVRIVIIR